MATFHDLQESEQIRMALQAMDSSELAHALETEFAADDHKALTRLRMAASLSLAQLIGSHRVDELLRVLSSDVPQASQENIDGSASTFLKWSAYLNAIKDGGYSPSPDDLLFFSAAGLLARQPTKVRSILRRSSFRESMQAIADEGDWAVQVRANISSAILLLIAQDSRQDIQHAGKIINSLSQRQKNLEGDWLNKRISPDRDAITLLGLYHLAQATIRTSEFLLVGSVETHGEPSTDIGPELRRLLIRSDEYLTLSADIDTQFWLNSIAIILWRLRTDSIWVSSRGISPRINNLLTELTRGERERNVFSLLPSQQEALRRSLLDTSKIAVVLQMPTSAGKTLIAEFAIVQTCDIFRPAKVVYVAPTRALVTQLVRTLSEDLKPIGIDVAAAGSAFEEDPYELQLLLAATGVVVATPEKLDLMFRAQPTWFEDLRLIIIDEAHLLQDHERGVRLELLLANIRRERSEVRLLLLTPFINNASQIATWLGGERGLPITVQWRPARILLGLCQFSYSDGSRNLQIDWKTPHSGPASPLATDLPVNVKLKDLSTTTKKVVFLSDRFKKLGAILALFTSSRSEAEKAAHTAAEQKPKLNVSECPPGLRVAIALAKDEYGKNSQLAFCLERGVAFHHSALSPTLRYLIEDQVRVGTIRFITATTTLAQGLNFPVSVVLIHSVNKPYNGGPLTSSEFWNVAGRAGRVGMADQGLVLFADAKHRNHWENYSAKLSDDINSALLQVINRLGPGGSLKEQYNTHEELRPFLQYLNHAAATLSPARALNRLEEILESSLANMQVTNSGESQRLRSIASQYLKLISRQQVGYLKVVDTTGLGSFSFDELYAKIGASDILSNGPNAILSKREGGMRELVEALRWLPELSLAIGLGEGDISVSKVAQVVQGWMDGKPIRDLASTFAGDSEGKRIRKAATYIYGTVAQTISWGAHAYLKGWTMRKSTRLADPMPSDLMLPAYIQYGVHSPEAAIASLLSIPRQLAEPFGQEYRRHHGSLAPEQAPLFRAFIEQANSTIWDRVTAESPLSSYADPADLRYVWRQMQGLGQE